MDVKFGSLKERVKDGTYTVAQVLVLLDDAPYVSPGLLAWLIGRK